MDPRTLKLMALAFAAFLLHAAARAAYLDDASALLFPREFELLLLGTFAALVLYAIALGSRVATAGAGLALCAVLALSLPQLASARLALLHSAVPVAPTTYASDRDAAGCLCATRASLHELFGEPALTSGQAPGAVYVYWLRRSGEVGDIVLYRLTGSEDPADRVSTVEHRSSVSETTLRNEGYEPLLQP